MATNELEQNEQDDEPMHDEDSDITEEMLSQSARQELLRQIEPLFDSLRRLIYAGEQAMNESFEQTGFEYEEAWDVLPHKAFSDALTDLHSRIDEVRQRIKYGSDLDITMSNRKLRRDAAGLFGLVNEFLAGEFSRMTKAEWQARYPNWHRSMLVPALDNESYWTIGDYIKPSKWALERRKELEAA